MSLASEGSPIIVLFASVIAVMRSVDQAGYHRADPTDAPVTCPMLQAMVRLLG